MLMTDESEKVNVGYLDPTDAVEQLTKIADEVYEICHRLFNEYSSECPGWLLARLRPDESIPAGGKPNDSFVIERDGDAFVIFLLPNVKRA